MKTPYNAKQKCPIHHHGIAATCEDCFDAAERQRNRQHQDEAKRLHELYLRRLAKAA